MKITATEFEECRALMQWAAWKKREHPELRLLFHIGNEHMNTSKPGKMPVHVARALVGVKAGVPDYCIPVARGGFHSLYLEIKRQGLGQLSKEQHAWIAELTQEGHEVVVCFGWEAAAATILEYLKLPK